MILKFTTSIGARIYRLPLMVFPNGFIGYSYLILDLDVPTLVDTGSGYDQSNQMLLEGIEAVRTEFNESITLTDIQRIIVTHGHVDHFGGVAFIAEQTGAQVGIHELDRRVLTAYEERVIVATKDLRVYLDRAGIPQQHRQNLIDMYGFAKRHVRSVHVDFSLDEDTEIAGMRFIHTPGHCPGQVCIQLGDTLLSADHILSRTTPHQAPESITHYTGLGHYRDSLRKVAHLDGIQLALGGHEDPISDFYGRITAIQQSHERKLNRVIDLIRDAQRPLAIAEITERMYPDKDGYEVLLALEECGAHVEYLYQHGQLSVSNLAEVEREDNPVLQYELSR
ncbi:MAG: MBL fold metallo-hydrolase [Anaerolineae bacterium]|jgi:glyoxylase-like metal-dependent hydrolase (beta-lactamase superfamily II)|nr:MBL fold metallo-hydrolase [Anaerolineae bacterium]